jgi:hypothetical protein
MTNVDQSQSVTLATARLLWELAKVQPTKAAIEAELDAGADVDAVAGYASVNRVGPLCWRALGTVDMRDRVRADVADYLEQEADLWRFREQLLVPHALSLMVTPLVEAGLEPVIFKGPVVAARYPAPGLRPMDDIDVMLPAADHATALAVLAGLGWKVIEAQHHGEFEHYLEHPDVPEMPLELHWDLHTWRDRAHGLRGIDLWKARVPTSAFGCDAYTVPIEDELVALASHAGKPFHHFNRLMWSVDIALVIDEGTVDWKRLDSLADRWGCKTVLAVALLHARRLGAAVPAASVQLPASKARRAALAPVLDVRWPVSVPEASVVRRMRYALWDSTIRNARLFVVEMSEDGSARRSLRRAALLASTAFRSWWHLRRAGPPDTDG